MKGTEVDVLRPYAWLLDPAQVVELADCSKYIAELAKKGGGAACATPQPKRQRAAGSGSSSSKDPAPSKAKKSGAQGLMKCFQ